MRQARLASSLGPGAWTMTARSLARDHAAIHVLTRAILPLAVEEEPDTQQQACPKHALLGARQHFGAAPALLRTSQAQQS
jgi:hypothetical protein